MLGENHTGGAENFGGFGLGKEGQTIETEVDFNKQKVLLERLEKETDPKKKMELVSEQFSKNFVETKREINVENTRNT